MVTHFPSPALPGSGIVGMISARFVKGTPNDLKAKVVSFGQVTRTGRIKSDYLVWPIQLLPAPWLIKKAVSCGRNSLL